MADDSALIWDSPTPKPTRRSAPTSAPGDEQGQEGDLSARISLREAQHRFGTKVSTLRSWARNESIDAVMVGGQWMVTPESIAHHLSRSVRSRPGPPPEQPATGPTDDGKAMIVPRDAWDRLMDQLGNIHESGLLLSEARERAAKAETEAAFLRERLSEMRSERDEARVMAEEQAVRARKSQPPQRTGWLDRLFGRG